MNMNVDTMQVSVTESYTKQDLIEIYDEHSPGIFRYAVRLLGDKTTAEDCVSETFSRLLGAVRRGGGPSENARAYLYRVAHNWITDFYRRRPLPNVPIEIDEHVDPDSNPEKLVSEGFELERVRTAILHLPPEQQQVIQLRFLEDWSHEEVAIVLSKSIDATRSMQYRALVSLRRMLSDKEEEEDNG
jgi:RNA polymerase sigma-70 factor (ECF subfamily)